MIERKEKKEEKSYGVQCRFESHGKQCLLKGTISPHTGGDPRFYCRFHFEALNNGDEFNTYHRFSKWLEEYREMYPKERYSSYMYDDNDKRVELVDQFHKYERNRLWEIMGNRD
jgi:hypothetical protein